MAGTIVVDRIESDASYTSTINVANRITFSNTVNFGVFAGTAPVAGFYLPTTNNLAFTTASTERMRIASDGNVGIGTTSLTTSGGYTSLSINNATNSGYLILQSNGTNKSDWYVSGGTVATLRGVAVPLSLESTGANYIKFETNGSERARIDSSGNLGIGTTAPQNKLQVKTTVRPQFSVSYDGTTGLYLEDATNSAWKSWKLSTSFGAGSDLSFVQSTNTNGTPTWAATAAMTFDASGNLLVGTTNSSGSSGNGVKLIKDRSGLAGYNSISTTSTATDASMSSYELYTSAGGAGYKFYVLYNGGVANYSASNVNLSDRREKTNFSPARSYLDVICAIPVQTFYYIHQDLEQEPDLTLGVVAQDVQAVAPELVTETKIGTGGEGEKRLAIYQTDLQYALMKCIQEMKAIIDTQASTITQLQADVAALKGA